MLNLYPLSFEITQDEMIRCETVLKIVILTVKRNPLQKFNEKFGFGYFFIIFADRLKSEKICR